MGWVDLSWGLFTFIGWSGGAQGGGVQVFERGYLHVFIDVINSRFYFLHQASLFLNSHALSLVT